LQCKSRKSRRFWGSQKGGENPERRSGRLVQSSRSAPGELQGSCLAVPR
jgi:hypothetical protein